MHREKVLKIVELYNRKELLQAVKECLEGASLQFCDLAKGKSSYVNKLLKSYTDAHYSLIVEEIDKEIEQLRDELDKL